MEAESRPSPTDRLPPLDGLRGLAAFLILAAAAAAAGPVGSNRPGWSAGVSQVAGDIFMILSGFGIARSLSLRSDASSFLCARVLRILPALAIALCVIVSLGSIGLAIGERPPTWWEGLLNLGLAPAYSGVRDLTGMGSVLAAFCLFYVLMALFSKVGWLRNFEWVAMMWVLLAITWHVLERRNWSPNPAVHLLLLGHAHLFVAGVIFFRLRADSVSTSRLWILLLCLMAQHFAKGMALGFASLFYFPLFLAIIWGQGRWLATAPLVLLGKVSFAALLLHRPVEQIVTRFTSAPGLCMPIEIVGSIVLGALVTYWVERPVRLLLRRWIPSPSASGDDWGTGWAASKP